MAIKNLYKVQKHINKRKGKNAVIHENSRDSRRLQRASARDEKIVKAVNARAKANLPHCSWFQLLDFVCTDETAVERVAYFQDIARTKTGPFTSTEVHSLIEDLLRQDLDEVASLKAERRPGRPPSNREQAVKQRYEANEQEFAAGLWVPDMLDAANVEMLRNWNQEWVSLHPMKFVRVAKNGTVKPSSFPPKGLS